MLIGLVRRLSNGKSMKKLNLLLAVYCALFFGGLFQSKQADVNIDNLLPVCRFTKQVPMLLMWTSSVLVQNPMDGRRLPGSCKLDADTFVYENENMETWVPKLLDVDKKR